MLLKSWWAIFPDKSPVSNMTNDINVLSTPENSDNKDKRIDDSAMPDPNHRKYVTLWI
ncbi:MAG: hypothetical protein AAFX57_06875 [Bacteroidota bacterium]